MRLTHTSLGLPVGACASRDGLPDVGATALAPNLPVWITPQLVERTLRVWQKYAPQPLTIEDAYTILLSVGRLFAVLARGGRHHHEQQQPEVRRAGPRQQP